MAGETSGRIPPARLDELREDFAEVDEDQDGAIDFGEFSTLMDNLGAGLSGEHLRIGFGEIDTNGDGRISLGEFIAWRTQE